MAQFLAPIINDQQEDSNGAPLSGGTIEVYLAGTSTPTTTYSDKTGLVPNTWPIVLNTLGVNNQGAVWLTGGSAYKYVIKSSPVTGAVVQRTIDNVSGINDSTASIDQWVAFAGVPTFVSATSFTVPGDQTQTFAFGARVKTVNTGGIVYGTVVRSTFAAATTVVIVPDSGALDSGLSSVSVGIIAPTNPSLPSTLITPPFRNRIFNSLFRNDQRNAGNSQTLVAAAAVAYACDRFYASCTGANATIQRIAGTGYQYAMRITGLASNTGTLFGQRIASSNTYDWVGQQVNVQIPISASGIATVTWNAYTADVTDVFSAKTLIATGTLGLSGTVETKFFSFNAGANALRGIAIEFVTGALLAGQTITYQGAVQAEAGQVSPLERVEEGEDLRRCQRYYWKTFPPATAPAQNVGSYIGSLTFFNVGANGFRYSVPYPVEMRAIPTLTTYSPNLANASWVGIGGGSIAPLLPFVATGTRQTDIGASGTIAGNETYALHLTASAEL